MRAGSVPAYDVCRQPECVVESGAQMEDKECFVSPSTQAVLAELRARLQALYGPRLVKLVLFGSQARGDAEPGADIDVLVVLRGDVSPGEEIRRTGDIVADLSFQHDETIACVFMDERRFTTRNGPLLRNVRREGVPL